MNKPNYYLPFILILIIFALLYKQCDNKVITPPSNSHVKKQIDSIHDEINDKKKDIEIFNKIAESKDSLIEKKHKPKWNKAKQEAKNDSIPCKETIVNLISACDSLVNAMDSLNKENKKIKSEYRFIVSKYDSLFPKYQMLAKIDSCTIDSLIRSRKKFWKGFKVGFGTGYVLGLITPVSR